MAANSTRRRRALFAAKFVAFLVVFYAFVAIGAVDERLIVPFTAGITRVSVAGMRIVDRNVHAVGTTIASDRFAMDVKNGCNAVETMMLFAAAVLAFPASARSRIIGLAVGLPVIQLVNVVRLATLYWIGSRHASWFEIFHMGVWQTAIILIGVAMFAIWSATNAALATTDRRA
jgi:exosortase H (IPTLxxWG-CTERM-specific)